MLLGKRPRPPMKRTTSLSEISFDLGDSSASHQPDHQQTNPTGTCPKQPVSGDASGGVGVDQRLFSSMVSPRNNLHRRHSADSLETPHFLKSCGLCKRRLVPGRDIYMYRGDSAFCSLECRQQQMIQDERKEKGSVASSKKQATAAAAAGSQVPQKGETVAAV